MKTINAINNLQTEASTITTTNYSLELSDADIKELLDVPLDARVTVHVPGGGDWSNQELNLSDRHTLDVKWQRVDEEKNK